MLFIERRPDPKRRERLGLLGELARGSVLFEPFRNAPTLFELQGCILKAVELKAKAAREARRKKRPLSRVQGPSLCVIMPSMSRDFALQAGASPMPGGRRGLYILAPMWRTVIVVVNELPTDETTLWLRLLGRGATQANAFAQLLELSERDPLASATVQLFTAWQQALPAPGQQREDDREMAINFERIYERWERRVKAEGKAEARAEGKVEGKAEAVLMVLEARGLSVTAAQRKQVLACTDIDTINAWLRAAPTTPSVKALLSGSAAPKRRSKAA